jgi:hypothetical protein
LGLVLDVYRVSRPIQGDQRGVPLAESDFDVACQRREAGPPAPDAAQQVILHGRDESLILILGYL